jgi:hypothetical protein
MHKTHHTVYSVILNHEHSRSNTRANFSELVIFFTPPHHVICRLKKFFMQSARKDALLRHPIPMRQVCNSTFGFPAEEVSREGGMRRVSHLDLVRLG